MKLILRSVTPFLILLVSSKVICDEVLDMMLDTFDDQYLECETEMEEAALDLLQKEKYDPQFNRTWEEAKKSWEEKKPHIAPVFKDEYGIAVVLYTMDKPFKMFQQLNGNVSIAGQSREYYMNQFRFKALHFYLTRALQILGQGCKERFTTYRGTWTPHTVAEFMRFGRFASTSKSESTAKAFGTKTFFTISTCYGVSIKKFSAFAGEQEVLIPVYEKFRLVEQNGNLVTLQGTGQRCSYFNCAYLGGQKMETPVCNELSSTWSVSDIVSGTDAPSASLNVMVFAGLALVFSAGFLKT